MTDSVAYPALMREARAQYLAWEAERKRSVQVPRRRRADPRTPQEIAAKREADAVTRRARYRVDRARELSSTQHEQYLERRKTNRSYASRTHDGGARE